MRMTQPTHLRSRPARNAQRPARISPSGPTKGRRALSLHDIMLEQLAMARSIVEDGAEVIPAWRITTPAGSFLILTRFHTDKQEQRERVLLLISRFMAWRMATSFVLTAETFLGPEVTRSGDEALLVVGVSHHERLAAMQRLRRADVGTFAEVEWLTQDQVDDTYFRLLPTGVTEITVEEAHELAVIFGKDGELAAERLS
jgi:hypothetical protein